MTIFRVKAAKSVMVKGQCFDDQVPGSRLSTAATADDNERLDSPAGLGSVGWTRLQPIPDTL
jgi:hypothetical protein